MKKCPYCAEEIQDEAIYCRYCRHDLLPESPKPSGVLPAHDHRLNLPSHRGITLRGQSVWGEATLISAVLYGVGLAVLAIRLSPGVGDLEALTPYAGLVIGGVIGGFLVHIPIYAAVLAAWKRTRRTRDLPPRGCVTYAGVYIGGVVFEVAIGLLFALVAGLAMAGLGQAAQPNAARSYVTRTPPPRSWQTPVYGASSAGAQATSAPRTLSLVGPQCTRWDEVGLANVGERKCVWGLFAGQKVMGDASLSWTSLFFGGKGTDFQFVNYAPRDQYTTYDITVGACIQSTGKIERIGNTPVIVLKSGYIDGCNWR